jgi:hypothetical protein
MFDFFKQKKENAPQDVKSIREGILRVIKEQLQKAEGGEGGNIRGIYLFITCVETEKHLYEAAVYSDDPERFKNEEVQKIADDFAIALPENWVLEISFTNEVPPQGVQSADVSTALIISTGKKPAAYKTATAYIRVLNGEAEKEEYTLTSSGGKVTIGREKKVQTADGFFRINSIAFPAESKDESNRYISRQHAHIEWDAESGAFLLFADEGGVPPRNKIKVRRADGGIVKLQATHFAHHLSEGDQIILGESALLEFSYSGAES